MKVKIKQVRMGARNLAILGAASVALASPFALAGTQAKVLQKAKPFTSAELQAQAWHPGLPGVETIEDAKGNPIGLSGRLTELDRESLSAEEAAGKFLTQFGEKAFKWDSRVKNFARLVHDYKAASAHRKIGYDELEVSAHVFVQLYKGIPIESRMGTVIVGRHSSENGFVIGGYFGNLGAEPALAAALSSQPKLSAEQSFTALAYSTSIPKGLSLFDIKGAPWTHRSMLVWSEVNGKFILAYRILASVSPEGDGARVNALVDANTGEVAMIHNDTQQDWHDDTIVTTAPALSATSAATVNIPVLADSFGGPSALASHVAPGARGLLSVNDAHNSDGRGDMITRSTPDFTDAAYGPLSYGTESLMNARIALDYLIRHFGWISWSGRSGDDVVMAVNFNDPNNGTSFNGYSRSGRMGLPNGTGGNIIFPSGVALDVVGHEIMHSVLEAANPLNYWYESGALNESLADFAGQCLRNWRTAGIASVCTMDGRGMRNTAHPEIFGQPDRSSAFIWMSGDNGGVHTNSGIVNKVHDLIIRGNAGDSFNGFVVTPFDSDIERSTDLASRLVYSSIFAHLYPFTSNLHQYGAGIYSWCRVQSSLWRVLGVPTNDLCGPLHDALVATELIDRSPYPTDITVRIDSFDNNLDPSHGLPGALVHYSLINLGRARFNSPVQIQLRSQDGTIVLASGGARPSIEPGETMHDSLIVSRDDVVNHLPLNAVLTVDVTDGTDSNIHNNQATITFSAQPAIMATSMLDIATRVDAGHKMIQVPVGSDGNFPLLGGDVATRLMVKFESSPQIFALERLGSGSPLQPRNPTTLLPRLYNYQTGVVVAEDLVSSNLSVTSSPLPVPAEPSYRIGVRDYPYIYFNSLGQWTDQNGQELPSRDLAFALLNADAKWPITPDSKWLYCINCISDATGYPGAVVKFNTGSPIESVFPADVVPILRRMIPRGPTSHPSFLAVAMPSWTTWFREGPGPRPFMDAATEKAFSVPLENSFQNMAPPIVNNGKLFGE